MGSVGGAELSEGFEEPVEQLIEGTGLEFDPEQLIKRLSFGLADLIVGVVERKDDAEVELFADPLEVGVFFGEAALEEGGKEAVVLLKRGNDLGGGQVELGEAATLVFDLFEEVAFALGEGSGDGSWGNGEEGGAFLGAELELFELQFKAALDGAGVRVEDRGEAAEVGTQLVAEDIGGVGEHRRGAAASGEGSGLVSSNHTPLSGVEEKNFRAFALAGSWGKTAPSRSPPCKVRSRLGMVRARLGMG
jgi:hypothetical protein